MVMMVVVMMRECEYEVLDKYDGDRGGGGSDGFEIHDSLVFVITVSMFMKRQILVLIE